MTTWSEIVENDVVEGAKGGLWTVLAKGPGDRVLLENVATGRRHEGQPNPGDEVKVAVPAAASEAAAAALTTVILGGEEIGHKNEDGRWMAPVTFVHTGSALGHLHVFHGVTLSAASFGIGEALAEHHRLHQERVPMLQEHVHDPDYHQVRGRAGVASGVG